MSWTDHGLRPLRSTLKHNCFCTPGHGSKIFTLKIFQGPRLENFLEKIFQVKIEWAKIFEASSGSANRVYPGPDFISFWSYLEKFLKKFRNPRDYGEKNWFSSENFRFPRYFIDISSIFLEISSTFHRFYRCFIDVSSIFHRYFIDFIDISLILSRFYRYSIDFIDISSIFLRPRKFSRKFSRKFIRLRQDSPRIEN